MTLVATVEAEQEATPTPALSLTAATDEGTHNALAISLNILSDSIVVSVLFPPVASHKGMVTACTNTTITCLFLYSIIPSPKLATSPILSIR